MQQVERKYDFLFSVIVPVYKTEQYVEETIQSVIGQTIGFEKNIQLILVNNATPDNAGAICRQYRDRYPRNVEYVELQVNRGPSGARNAGIPYIRGKYVNFLDSDDKWELDAFEKAYGFFEANYDRIDMAACRMHKFDAEDRWDTFDYKFARSGVYDIRTEQKFLQFNASSVILKREVLERHRFDEQINHTEDMKFLNGILLETCVYGIVREAVFQYRKRPRTGGSLMQVREEEKPFYFDVVRRSFFWLVDLSKEKYGQVLPYVQYLLMQEFMWRIRPERAPETLTAEELEEYFQLLRQIFLLVDDYIINTYSNIWKEHRLFCLRLKYGEDVFEQFQCRNGGLWFHDLRWMDLSDGSALNIVEQHLEGDELCLDLKVNVPFPKEYYAVFARDDRDRDYAPEEYPGDESNIRCVLGTPCLVKRCFRLRIPLKGVKTISFFIRWGKVERELWPGFGKFSKLTRKLKSTYWLEGKYLFTMRGGRMTVKRAEAGAGRARERQVRRELLKKGNKRALALRMLQPAVRRMLGKKRLWIVSDRPTRAGDNGEYFFRYLCQHPPRGTAVRFAISKKSPDYRRMKTFGPVVNMDGFVYQLLFLAADKVISSTWGFAVDDPFGWHREWIRDLLRSDYIYLDHALTKDDVSADVNKHKRNFAMWTTGSRMETESIRRFPYGFAPSVPRTTGLARYDAIWPAASQAPGKQLLLAPTWRKSLAPVFEKDGTVAYNETFRESEFYQFYEGLINDPRLLEVMRARGYKGVLKLHPLIAKQAQDFTLSDVFAMSPEGEPYEKEFFDNALVVTDYSSIAMDFSYVNRAVVYAQFDKEEFYRLHSYHESYFDYEKDGFGPVCYDYESTVQALIGMIERDCAVEEEYRRRRERFFAYLDDENCRRICDEILGGTERQTA